MKGLLFVGMVGPDSHNKEEGRFVELLAEAFEVTHYLRGAGVKSLRPHQVTSLAKRLAGRRRSHGRPNLILGSLYIIPFRRLAWQANVRWLRHQLREILKTAGGHWTLWIRFPSPELVAAVATLQRVRIIYEPIDLYSAAEELSPRERVALLAAETNLVRFATVVTGGRLLADRFAAAAGGTYWFPFGGDQRPPATALPARLGGKLRIALVGCLDWRVDEFLLASVMLEHPKWQLVLAGPRVRPWGKYLRRLPNVDWLGRIPIERVRPLIQACDATLVPYRLTDWTSHCLPVKVFEYLAEGKPVIATPLPELELLADVVTISPVSGYAAAIEAAIAGDNESAQERRRQAATRYTLQHRARRAIELMKGNELQVATP